MSGAPQAQRGVAMIIFTIGMVAIIGMAGLALDMGHAYLNKTRLQNALDAAALSGAKTLNAPGATTADATTAALNTFNQHREGELSSLTALPAPTVEFSATLNPWVPGAVEPAAKYVRVSAPSFNMTVWLARVLPGVGTTQIVGGTAVSGPIPLDTTPPAELCDIAPLLMCGDASDPDTDCSDGGCYGYHPATNEEITLKTHSGSYQGDWEVGPGNFQLLRLGCSGGDCLRENLAGGYEGCAVDGETLPTQPGNNVGPVAQGFNTRFNQYQGGGPDINAETYPPDTVIHYDGSGPNDFWYDDYKDYSPVDITPIEEGGTGVAGRRILVVPIGNCTGTTNGQGDVGVLGFGCFFMTKPASHAGNTQEIFGELVGECKAAGTIAPGPPPGGGPTLYKIVLYKDPINPDS